MQERLESPTASRLWSAASPITSVSRVALLSVHTCPLDQPGMGDSGGMNVYVRSVARRLAEMGVAVDIFTRWSGKGELVREVDPGVRVIHLIAGPDRPVPKEELDEHVCEFLYSLLRSSRTRPRHSASRRRSTTLFTATTGSPAGSGVLRLNGGGSLCFSPSTRLDA